MDDNAIIDLLWERSERAISEIERKYGRLCFRTANNILHNSEDAQQCVNDAYLSVWESVPPLRPTAFSAFLSKITRNKALDRVKYNNRQKRANPEFDLLVSELNSDISSGTLSDDSFNAHYIADVIDAYLRGVPEKKAAVFIRRYFFCCSVAEISELTGYSRSKITTMLCRMRRELRQKLSEQGVEL